MAVSPLLIGILTSLAVAVWFVVAAAVAKSVVYFAMAITDYRSRCCGIAIVLNYWAPISIASCHDDFPHHPRQ